MRTWNIRRVVATIATLGVVLAFTAHPATAGQSRAPRSYQDQLTTAIADIQSYWSSEFPTLFGSKYQKVRAVIAAGPGTRIPACQGEAESYKHDVKGNAFYCFKTNFIVYDDASLMPQLARDFSPFATALVLAHEWGHAIQDRAGVDRANAPTIILELQADCFAGSWVQRVANGDSRIKLAGGDLDQALAAYLEFRDAVGSEPTDQEAHGDAFDRVNAFQTGFENGAGACTSFFESPPPITEQSFATSEEEATGGNLPADEVLPATVDLLNGFYTSVASSVPALTIDRFAAFDSTAAKKKLPQCGGSTLARPQIRNRVFYCLDDNYIAFEGKLLDDIYSRIGDFGDAVLVANAYATYVQYQQEFPGVADNTPEAVFGADCYTGAWAGAIANAGSDGVPAPSINSSISLAPGDLDKVIQAFLVYDTVRGVPSKADFLFLRLQAFRQGFLSGYESCASFAQ